MKHIISNNGFDIYFDCNSQSYVVYKDNCFLIGNIYSYRQVECYIK